MENVKFFADSKFYKWRGKKFKGVKVFSLENDVLSIEMNDGRVFLSPLSTLHGNYRTGNPVINQSPTYHHAYNLWNDNGNQLKLKFADWEGFRDGFGYMDDRRIKMFEIIESAPDVKASSREIIGVILSVIAVVGWVIYKFI